MTRNPKKLIIAKLFNKSYHILSRIRAWTGIPFKQDNRLGSNKGRLSTLEKYLFCPFYIDFDKSNSAFNLLVIEAG